MIRLKVRETLTVLSVTMIAISLAAGPALSGAGDESRDRTAVLDTVQEFFDAMSACDAAAASKVLEPDGRFFRVPEGSPNDRVNHFDNAAFLDRLEDCEEVNVERFWNAEVRVHGLIAMVWAPYDFWSDGRFSHCGVDLFNLVKTESGWRIVGGVYTIEKENCEESPLGSLVR